MSQNNNRRKFTTLHIVFTVCFILIFVPAIYFGWMLVSTYLDSHSPVLGNRYENDLNPAITKDQLTQVDNAVSQIEGVDSHEVHLATGTLRVYIDVADDATPETVQAISDSAYQAVVGVLDPAVYFSQANGMKMYDLEIHTSNIPDGRDAEYFVYGINTKTSSMDSPQYQLVSVPKNAEIAQSLRDAVEARKAAEAAAEAEQQAQQDQPAEEQPAEGEEKTEAQQ
ncbi:MAG: hypothetical protein MR283_06165 [Erysipelotrichaceae bacterium]|nr:hypothetical protein [Erysipelotrichaceae bacterium]MDY6034526.1 hypothetical protein [Bulleidia sp.]